MARSGIHCVVPIGSGECSGVWLGHSVGIYCVVQLGTCLQNILLPTGRLVHILNTFTILRHSPYLFINIRQHSEHICQGKPTMPNVRVVHTRWKIVRPRPNRLGSDMPDWVSPMSLPSARIHCMHCNCSDKLYSVSVSTVRTKDCPTQAK
jgi:hypothetical protein